MNWNFSGHLLFLIYIHGFYYFDKKPWNFSIFSGFPVDADQMTLSGYLIWLADSVIMSASIWNPIKVNDRWLN